MKIKLDIKPKSINSIWQGQRFYTKEGQQYKNTILTLLLAQKIKPLPALPGNIEVHYRFFLKNLYKSDVDNYIKTLTDCLTQAKIIQDDRYILKYVIEKIKSESDYIEIEIKNYENQ